MASPQHCPSPRSSQGKLSGSVLRQLDLISVKHARPPANSHSSSRVVVWAPPLACCAGCGAVRVVVRRCRLREDPSGGPLDALRRRGTRLRLVAARHGTGLVTVEINYQVSDSGCVVTVRGTGVASLAPRTRIRETDSTHGGRRTLNVASPSHFAWLLIAPRHNI
eukprot:COSAG06_NODE_7920_length_2333_cov_21.321397_2_plen_165_part_00